MTSKTSEGQLIADAVSTLGTQDFCLALSNYIKALANFDSIIFVAYFENQSPWTLHRYYRDVTVIQCLDTEYIAGLYLLDPAYQLHINKATAGIYRLRDIAPDQFRRTEYFKRYYEKTTIIDEQIVLVTTKTNITITICVCRDHTSNREFSTAARKRLKEAAPALCALMSKNWVDLHPPTKAAKGDPNDIVQNIIHFAEHSCAVKLTRRQAQGNRMNKLAGDK